MDENDPQLGIVCRNCSQPNPADSEFCNRCGEVLITGQSETGGIAAAKPASNPKVAANTSSPTPAQIPLEIQWYKAIHERLATTNKHLHGIRQSVGCLVWWFVVGGIIAAIIWGAFYSEANRQAQMEEIDAQIERLRNQ